MSIAAIHLQKKLEVLDGPAEDAPTTPAPEAAGAEPATSENAGASGAAAADECAAGKSPQGKLQRDTAPKRAQGEQLDKKKEQYEQLIKKVKVKLEKYAKEAADLVASGKVRQAGRKRPLGY